MEPAALIRRMALAYSNCESYEDDGVVLLEPKISNCPHGTRFRTCYVCPDKFLFEWSWHGPMNCDQEISGSILVHGDLGAPRLGLDFKDTRTGRDIYLTRANSEIAGLWSDMVASLNHQPLQLAIAMAGGFSMGAAMVVPPLLFPDLCYLFPSPTKVSNIQVVGKEQQAKFDCDRLKGIAVPPSDNPLAKSKMGYELWLDGGGMVRKCKTSFSMDAAEMRRVLATGLKMMQEGNIPSHMGINVNKMMASVRKLSRDYGLPDFREFLPLEGIPISMMSKMTQTVIFNHASFNCNVNRLLTVIEQRSRS